MLDFVKRNIWVTFLIGAVLGYLFSNQFKLVSPLNNPILMLILFLTFLKIDLHKIHKYVGEVKEITYLTAASMLFIPVIVHIALQFVNFSSDLELAVFLLSALPAAASSAAIVNALNFKSELDVILTVTTSAIGPFTLTALFLLLYGKSLHIDLVSFFITNAILVIVPLVAAKLLMKRLHKVAQEHAAVIDILSISLIALLFAAAIAVNKGNIHLENDVLFEQGVIFISLILTFILSAVLTFNLKADEIIAFCASKIFTSILLGITIASQFLGSGVAAIMTMAIVPWSVMFIVFKVYSRIKKLNVKWKL